MLLLLLLIAGIGFFDFPPGGDASDYSFGGTYQNEGSYHNDHGFWAQQEEQDNRDWGTRFAEALFGQPGTGLGLWPPPPPPPPPPPQQQQQQVQQQQQQQVQQVQHLQQHSPWAASRSSSSMHRRTTGGGRCHCGKYSLDGASTEVVGNMQLWVLRHAKLGSGAVGSIYHADWPSGSRCVAVKETTRVDTFQFAKQEIAILGEFKAMGAQHIVHMFDYQIGRERIQIVLELGGPNLEEHWLDLGGPEKLGTDAKTVAKAMKGVALTLIEAHKKGAHLDVKPANLVCFVSAKPCTLKLIDFNSFKAFDSAFIHARHNFADPRYVSPEMVVPRSGNRERPFEVSKKSDSWSFGIMFYELIYGAEMADSVRAQIASIAQRMRAGELSMKQAIGPVQSVLANVNYGRRSILANGGKLWALIVGLLKKCIQLKPSDRPTAQQIYDELPKEV